VLLLAAAGSCLPRRGGPPLSVPGRTARVLVDLRAQADLPALRRAAARRGSSKKERRARVAAALADLAAHSQASLRSFLEEERRAGRVRAVESFSIVNRLYVEAAPETVAALGRRPEVAAVSPATVAAVPSLAEGAEDHDPPEKTSWALAALGAPAAWERGLDGSGVVVGIIDSGASAAHEQLAAGFRGGGRSWLDPADPANVSAAPHDTRFGHGTGVLSCAVGRNTAGVTLGVAPGAQWIACAGLPEGRYDPVLVTRCADWMLRTGQPDVLIAAWLLPADGCDRSLERIVAAWRTAEILPVFAAGNHGPAPSTDRSPANYRSALSVGGSGRDGAPLPESSRGPSRCGGSVFPLLMAPAEDLAAAFPLSPSTYRRARGTSFAAGLAAGAAALLVQSDPEASVTALEQALTGGSDADGPGRLDVPAALARLHRIGPLLPGPSMARRTRGSGGPPKESRRSWNARQAGRPPRGPVQSSRSLRIISLPRV
jgi:subtilisin family serine protease